MERIATLTMNPAVDRNTSVDNVVQDRKLRCERPRLEPGGGGINVSRAVRKLGGESTAVFPCGGHSGRLFCDLLDREGIDRRAVPVQGDLRQNLIVLETTSGGQFRFGMPGPRLEREEWEACLAEVDSLNPKPDWLVASGSLPEGVPADFLGRMVRSAASSGTRVIVDTSGEALRRAAEEKVFLLKPNMRELSLLAGEDLETEERQAAAATRLIEKGCCRALILSLGAAGALLVTAQGTKHLRSPTVPIRSRVGAGDSMVAGVVLSLARGKTVEEAARFGIAAGAAAVMTPGTELCTREDTERLFRQMAAEAGP